METKRQLQIASMMKQHMSAVLQQESGYIHGNEIMVTVTDAKISPDMTMAKIYVSVFNTEDKDNVVAMLNEAMPRLRQILGSRLRNQMRRLPETVFYIDDTLDEMYRLRALFDGLHESQQMGDHRTPEDDDALAAEYIR